MAWRVLSLGRYRQYQLTDGGKVVATADVMPRVFAFAFMPKGERGIHVGPCHTAPSHRGRGLYPWLLRRIMADYADRADRAYIICADTNSPSLRGIAKAGFERYAAGHKEGRRYVIDR